MAYRLIDLSADDPRAFRDLGTFPTIADAKVAIVDAIMRFVGERPHQMIAEPDLEHDGLDVLVFIPGTAMSMQFAVNACPA